ncbi:MAG TPA: MFS transporter [Caulobacteraceae bacterium]|jgi:hypothetical protein
MSTSTSAAISQAGPVVAEAPVVHEAVGPPLRPLAVVGVVGVGINSLLSPGLFPILLGVLDQEHRLSAQGIGIAAMIELLAMGVATGLASVFLPARGLRWIGALGCLALAGLDVGTAHATGWSLLAWRGAAGVTEGVLLWITIGMIARSATPERWAAVFYTTQVVAQFAVSVAFTALVIPRYGAAGAYLTLAVCSVLSVAFAAVAPQRYAGLLAGQASAGAPPPRGWIALGASLVMAGASSAIGVYLEPFAIQAGLSPGVANSAVAISLGSQVIGGSAATFLAGRVRYIHVFLVGGLVEIACWSVFAMHVPPGWNAFGAPLGAVLFIAANALSGFVGLILGPFLVPMLIEADPSRRAAMQSGGAQLLGSAAGPGVIGAFVVSDGNVHGAVVVGVAMLLAGLAVIAWLHMTSAKLPSPLSPAEAGA